MKNFVRYFVSAVSLFLTTVAGNCQKISYSEKEFTGYNSYHIIGQVKDHIIVWKRYFEYSSKSEIIIYDLNMHVLKRVHSDVLKSLSSSVNFINNTDSFQIIFHTDINNQFVCKRAAFDENGNLLNTEQLITYKTDKFFTQRDNNLYQVFNSNDGKDIALIYVSGSDSLNVLFLNYIFLNQGQKYVGYQALPFNFKTSTIGDIIFDKGNFVFSMLDITDSSCQLNLFKINMETDSVINTLRQIQDGFLVNNSIIINPSFNNYAITAHWKDRNKQTNGIFVWQLNNDLTDKVTDTVIEKSSDSNSVTYKLQNFLVSDFYNNKNTQSVFVFSSNALLSELNGTLFSKKAITVSPNNFSYYNTAIGAGGVIAGTNPFTGAYRSGYATDNTLNEFIANSVSIDNSRVYRNNSDTPLNKNAIQPQNFGPPRQQLSMLEINTNNKVLNKQTFTGFIDKDAISYINQSKVFKLKNGFYILFDQHSKGNKQTMGFIKIPNGAFDYTYNHLILMQLKYKLLLEQSVQINDNALLIPGYLNENIVFVSIQFN